MNVQSVEAMKFKHIIFDHDGTLVNTTVYPRSLYAGMKELLKLLSSQGVSCYVWTARNRASTVEILESLAIIGQFKALSCGGEMTPKPSIDGLEALMIEAPKEEILVVGDSFGDVIGGASFGAYSVGALWGHGTESARSQMEQVGANQCFSTVADFRKFLSDKI